MLHLPQGDGGLCSLHQEAGGCAPPPPRRQGAVLPAPAGDEGPCSHLPQETGGVQPPPAETGAVLPPPPGGLGAVLPPPQETGGPCSHFHQEGDCAPTLPQETGGCAPTSREETGARASWSRSFAGSPLRKTDGSGREELWQEPARDRAPRRGPRRPRAPTQALLRSHISQPSWGCQVTPRNAVLEEAVATFFLLLRRVLKSQREHLCKR